MPGGSETNGRADRAANERSGQAVGVARHSSSVNRSCRSDSRGRGSGRPGYSSPRTRSNWPDISAGNAASGSASVTSTRSPGCSSASPSSVCGTSARTAVWNAATRSVPTVSCRDLARAASARSISAIRRSACSTSTSACGVNRTRRPAGSSSRTPVSFSSVDSCWDTADGL